MTRQGGPAVGTVHCIEFAVILPLRGRERHAAPLQWRVRSAILPGNLQLPMALATRKGHAASVRRQSRQRLRSERRYRRNRSVRFYRHLVRTGSAFPRLPRRFAPRNDTSGQRSNGNGAAHRIGGTTAASRTGLAVPAPTGPVRIERRPAYDPFFILQYSLFLISSIPLRGMANHMTKRPEIPCLSCKFPQSRRICH